MDTDVPTRVPIRTHNPAKTSCKRVIHQVKPSAAASSEPQDLFFISTVKAHRRYLEGVAGEFIQSSQMPLTPLAMLSGVMSA